MFHFVTGDGATPHNPVLHMSASRCTSYLSIRQGTKREQSSPSFTAIEHSTHFTITRRRQFLRPTDSTSGTFNASAVPRTRYTVPRRWIPSTLIDVILFEMLTRHHCHHVWTSDTVLLQSRTMRSGSPQCFRCFYLILAVGSLSPVHRCQTVHIVRAPRPRQAHSHQTRYLIPMMRP